MHLNTYQAVSGSRQKDRNPTSSMKMSPLWVNYRCSKHKSGSRGPTKKTNSVYRRRTRIPDIYIYTYIYTYIHIHTYYNFKSLALGTRAWPSWGTANQTLEKKNVFYKSWRYHMWNYANTDLLVPFFISIKIWKFYILWSYRLMWLFFNKAI